VRRHLHAGEAQAVHQQELEQQRALRDKIALDQQAIESKLNELRARCAALSSREARCAAQSAHSTSDVERVFERWEARLDGVEGSCEDVSSVDTFARSLSHEEEKARAEAELDRILSESPEVSS
jgi:hypothetical protein